MRFPLITAVVGLSASLAWPCSGEQCNRHGEIPLIDGGLPSNFPLLVTDVMGSAGSAQVLREDGGGVVTQVRALDGTTAVIDTAPLVEGQRYQVTRTSGCQFSDAGVFVHDFVVQPSRPVLTQGIRIELEDAGWGLVPQYSGASCSEGVPSTFARFRFVVDPAVAASLPFYEWHLGLQPSDGGALVAWHVEGAGMILSDGSLRSVPNSQLAPRRISTVFHACDDGGFGFPVSRGAPAGRYRAVLSGRVATTDAGFDTVSDEFELSECGDGGFVEPPDAGADFDGGSVSRDGGAGSRDGGAVTPDGGSETTMDGGVYTGVLGPSADRGCSVGGGSALLLLVVLALRRRR